MPNISDWLELSWLDDCLSPPSLYEPQVDEVKLIAPKVVEFYCNTSAHHCVEASKITATTWGKITQSGPWLVTPFPFGVVTLTRDNGTIFLEEILIVLVG